ncbi:hypothetical protein, partial [Mucilaginibacter segetis]
RRFVWKKQTADSTMFLPEQGLHISGTLLTNKQEPISGSKVSAFAVIGGAPFFADTLTNAGGRFNFDRLEFYGERSFAIQAKDVKNRYKTIIRPDSLPLPLIQPLPPLMPADTVATPLLAEADASKKRFTEMEQNNVLRRGVQLKQVDIKAKKKVYSSVGDRMFADEVIDNEKIKDEHSLATAITKANPFIRFDKNNEPHYTGGRPLYKHFETVVDGALMDNGMIQQLGPDEVESIEILHTGLSLGVFDSQIIVINTKLHDPYHNYSKDVVAGMKAIKLQGYYQSREFYIPKYDAENKKADLRDVVYWNPDIIPDENGEASVEFPNMGSKGTYRVVMEGIGAKGQTGRTVFIYTVE